MAFIVENYLWFVIGLIVILMAVVGFVAEKTDFGRKPFSKKGKVAKDGKTAVENEVESILPEITAVPDETAEVGENTQEDIPETEDVQTDIFETENVQEEIPEESTNLFEMPEQTDFNEVEIQNLDNDTDTEEQEPVDKSLFEPLPSIDEVSNNEDAEQTEEDIDVPSAETPANEEDVWKF